MLKTTLYAAAAVGALATASVVTPATAAPAAKFTPEVQASHVTDVHERRWRRHHGWHHGHHHHYGWYHHHHYHPGVGIYAPGFGARVYTW